MEDDSLGDEDSEIPNRDIFILFCWWGHEKEQLRFFFPLLLCLHKKKVKGEGCWGPSRQKKLGLSSVEKRGDTVTFWKRSFLTHGAPSHSGDR